MAVSVRSPTRGVQTPTQASISSSEPLKPQQAGIGQAGDMSKAWKLNASLRCQAWSLSHQTCPGCTPPHKRVLFGLCSGCGFCDLSGRGKALCAHCFSGCRVQKALFVQGKVSGTRLNWGFSSAEEFWLWLQLAGPAMGPAASGALSTVTSAWMLDANAVFKGVFWG